MIGYLFVIIASFLVSYYLISFYLIKLSNFSKQKNISQQSQRWGNSNKSHLGGISFTIPILFITFISFYLSYSGSYELTQNDKIIISIFLIILISTFVGLIDEKFGIGPFWQFINQILICIILIWSGCIINITPIFYINIIFTIFWIVAFINALNLFDNVDTALGSYTTSLLCFFIFLGLINNHNYFLLLIMFSYIGSLLAFLRFNYFPSKIFMGEVGSLQLSSVLAGISIYFLWGDYSYSHYFDSFYYLLQNNLVFLIVIIDTFLILSIRIANNVSPFKGDTNHLSHMTIKLGLNPNQFSFLVCILNLIIFLFYFSMVKQQLSIENTSVLISFYVLIIALISLIYYFGKIRKDN